MEKGKTVSRAVYQKLAEENKKLKADLKVLCFDGLSSDTIMLRIKWRNKFKKEADFNATLKTIATEYIKEHPEYDITKRIDP